MITTTDLETFRRLNHLDLVRFLSFKGVHNADILQDVLQAFYLRAMANHALNRFDPALGSFEAYILKILQNVLLDYLADQETASTLSGMEPIAQNDCEARIRDFARWIEGHCGKAVPDMLACLKDRMLGYELSESKRTTYYRYLRIYLRA
jgi:hypothetical protein